MEQLFDSILLSHGVDVGDLVLGDGGEVQVDLQHKLLYTTGLQGRSKEYLSILERKAKCHVIFNHVGWQRSPWPLVGLYPGNRFFLQKFYGDDSLPFFLGSLRILGAPRKGCRIL